MPLWKKIKQKLLGKPIATRQAQHERLTNIQGLAIFGADAMSSTAYATEEILYVLAAAGVAHSIATIWISLAIVILILIVAISYRQVIFAYPQGGGVYNVAKENLGETAALVGGASLWIDYILTVAVSVAAGIAAITSAFPILYPHRVALGIVVILILMWANLRGVRESGKIFSIPTYIFIGSFGLLILYGVLRFLTGTFPVIAPSPDAIQNPLGPLALLLILHAFAAGCTAMTGIEATSNGVQAFKAPESKNAAKTMTWMAIILGSIFLGVSLLAYWSKVVPLAHETIISQIAHALFDGGPFYYLIQVATALILLLAANTPFADFPRVASQHAKDGYFPRQFFNLGSRLVFTNGIIVLSVAAGILLYLFGGSVNALIPLYAVGVFLGFSMSQIGMIVHWKRLGAKKHKRNIIINAVGFVASSIVFIVVFFSKFSHGAWILVPSIIGVVLAMKQIKKHYDSAEKMVELGHPTPETAANKMMIILVSRLSRATLHAIRFAKSLNPVRMRAVHVAIDQKAADELKEKWPKYVPDVPLDILPSEYRDLIEPLLLYLADIEKQYANDSLIVVMPQFVPEKFWQHFLYNKTTSRLHREIEQDPRNHAQILEVPIKSSQFK